MKVSKTHFLISLINKFHKVKGIRIKEAGETLPIISVYTLRKGRERGVYPYNKVEKLFIYTLSGAYEDMVRKITLLFKPRVMEFHRAVPPPTSKVGIQYKLR